MNAKNSIIFFAFSVLICAFSVRAQTSEMTVNLQNPKTGESHFTYIPFDVPERTESLSFTFEYDKKDGANRLEFGVFEPPFTGKDSDRRGLRGWSGSVRGSVFIAEDRATRGYSAGEIPAGKWFLVVGLAKIAPAGVDFLLKVKINEIDEDARRQYQAETDKKFTFETHERPETLKSAGLEWFRGDLHNHTFHGDGNWSVRAILDSATSNSLDFVAITEHNTFSHHKEIGELAPQYPRLLILRGEEVTTYGAHINVWGLPTGAWVDFRVLPGLAKSAEQISAQAHSFGALASINHPTMNCGGCNWTYNKDWSAMDSVEIWNATWDADDEAALKIWDDLLQKGSFITAVGSSDSHYPPYEPSPYPNNLAIGNPTVFVGAKSLNQKDLLNGVKNGRVFVSQKPQYQIKLTADKKYSIGDRVEFARRKKVKIGISLLDFPSGSRATLISNGKVLSTWQVSEKAFEEKFVFDTDKSNYVRLEVRNTKGEMLGFTNPIFFIQKSQSR